MSVIADVLKELFPTFKEAVKNGFLAFRTSKRRRQHIFVLKAITRPRLDHGLIVDPTEGWRYDLATIDRKLYIAHVEAAIASHENEDVALLLSPEEQEEFRKELKAIQKKYGLPTLTDPKRAEKIEAILHDMGPQLRFHPPNSWSIR